MDWIACNKKRFAKSIKRDNNLINSLVQSSIKKLKTQSRLPLNGITATSKITLVYDSLREVLEALAIANGFKIYNHECYRAFLSEVLKESALSKDFDGFRKLRNSINYYGKDVSAEEAKQILADMQKLIKEVKKLLNNKITLNS